MKRDMVEEVHPPITDISSGRNYKRPGLRELIKLAKDRSIDYLYVYDLDRVCRCLCFSAR
jgi:DNA invertase Pin-like site-specific DNA recombinase